MNISNKISVYVVEDYQLIRKSLNLIMGKADDIELIGDFENAEDFFEVFEQRPSNVVLMDLGLPGLNGLAATKIIKEKYPQTKVIVLTSHEHPDEVIAALALGANAYCLKDLESYEINKIIREVHKGAVWIHPKVSDAAKIYAPRPNSTDFDNLYSSLGQEANLTERELEVLQRIVDGKTNTEIAGEMNISVHTAKAHVGNILDKLAVSDRVKAAVKAIRNNIIN